MLTVTCRLRYHRDISFMFVLLQRPFDFFRALHFYFNEPGASLAGKTRLTDWQLVQCRCGDYWRPKSVPARGRNLRRKSRTLCGSPTKPYLRINAGPMSHKGREKAQRDDYCSGTSEIILCLFVTLSALKAYFNCFTLNTIPHTLCAACLLVGWNIFLFGRYFL